MSVPRTRSNAPARAHAGGSSPKRHRPAVTSVSCERSGRLRRAFDARSGKSPASPSVSTTSRAPSAAANMPTAPVPAPSSSTRAPRTAPSLRRIQRHIAPAERQSRYPTLPSPSKRRCSRSSTAPLGRLGSSGPAVGGPAVGRPSPLTPSGSWSVQTPVTASQRTSATRNGAATLAMHDDSLTRVAATRSACRAGIPARLRRWRFRRAGKKCRASAAHAQPAGSSCEVG
mmetsp:Transcript_27644/g.91978  ORF Transcript_27644/g.91978 Transcript_27644/m.91978 type:complete len:229 (+) Transcript_27644:533-1219(+)